MDFQRVVSLGSYCVTASQIYFEYARRTGLAITGFQEIKSHARANGFNGGSHLLDWVMWKNPRKVAGFLAKYASCTNFFERSNLYPSDDQQAVLDVATGISWYHLFPRNPDTGRVVFKDETYAQALSKALYLLDKFIGLREYRSLYVMSAHGEHAEAIVEGLHRGRGNDDFRLLVIDSDRVENGVASHRSHAHHDVFTTAATQKQAGPYPWLGNHALWSDAFAPYSF